MTEMRGLTLVCVLALVVAAVPAAGGTATAPAFDATVELPDRFQVGENEVSVVVDNTGNDAVLFSPVIEIPLGTAFTAPSPDPSVDVDGASESRTFAVTDASYRGGDSLFVYGEEVPAGETRTYTFTLVVGSAGERTVEADVRPLYNEPNNVRDSATGTALGTGTVNVEVTDGAGTTLPGATVTVDGEDRAGGDQSLSVLEGSHTVSASVAGETLPELDVDLAPGGTANLSFAAPDSLVAPQVVATSANGSVADDSVLRQTTRAGSATAATAFEVSFAVESDAGTTVVGVGPPPEIPDAYESVSATDGGTSVPVTTASDGTLLVTLSGAGPHDVTVTFDGYATGDADGDGTVDSGDAKRIADAVAGTTTANPYGDVNGDGRVTAVDAMLVAQYEAGNRDAEFRRVP